MLTDPPETFDEKTIIVSCEEEFESCSELVKMGYHIYSAEFLLSGILQQQLNFDA